MLLTDIISMIFLIFAIYKMDAMWAVASALFTLVSTIDPLSSGLQEIADSIKKLKGLDE